MRPQPMEPLPAPPGAQVPMRRAVRHPREIVTLVIAIVGSFGLLLLAIAEVGLAFTEERAPDVYALVLLFAPVLLWYARGQLWAQQRLNGVKLTRRQYPEAHAMLVDAAARSGLPYVPDAWVVGGNGLINAAASGHGFRRFVIVYSDLLEVGGAARDPDALRFVIAHEVGHIAAGHASYWRMLGTFASQWIPLLGTTLSRAQEYTADNYGHALVPQGARGAMATLAGGKYLNRTVDADAMADRAIHEPGFFVWVANATASHPPLVWRMHALRDRRAPGRLLWRPKAPWLWSTPIDPTAWSLPARIGFEPTPPPRAALPQAAAPHDVGSHHPAAPAMPAARPQSPPPRPADPPPPRPDSDRYAPPQ